MKSKLKEIINLLAGKEMAMLPSGLAFSLFLSIIPVLSIIFFIVTSLHLSMEYITEFINKTFNPGVATLMQPVITSGINLSSLITIIFGLIIATNGCYSIISASNTIFKIESSNYIKRFGKALIMMVIMLVLLMFLLIVPLLGESILKLLNHFGNFIKNNEALVGVLYIILRVPISLVVIFVLVKLLYKIAPDQKIKSAYVNKGAAFTTISWLIVTMFFSYYINNIARYDLIYGNLANIVILMLWIYFLAYIFVIGLVLNKNQTDAKIDETNTIKLSEIRKKIKDKEK